VRVGMFGLSIRVAYNRVVMNAEGNNAQFRRAGPGSPLLAGLLLGLLLTLFIAVLVYVAATFLALGQQALAEVPALPPLALPQLVRAAPAAESSAEATTGVAVNAPSARRPQESAPALTGRVTVLVMGVDNRPDEPVARTDTIMVLTLNPKTGAAGMLSIPRDMLVHVAALNDDIKINSVHVYGEINRFPGGGPELLRQTVAELIGYPIDYYVRINFDGFRKIVDLVGGIDIDVPKDIKDDLYPDENYGYDPLFIPAGRHHMDGALALKYARTRHVDSDYGRAARQQQVMMALKDKLTQPGQLAGLLPRIPGLAAALAGSIQTDMPIDKAIALARTVDQVDLKNPTRIVIDNTMGTDGTDPKWGYVLRVDMNKLRAATAAVFADLPAGVSAAEAARQAVKAEGARVVVLNGTPEAGLGAAVADALAAAGYTVVNVGNADRGDYAETLLIVHGDGKVTSREELVRRFNLPPARVRSEPPSDTVDLTLILGSDQVKPKAASAVGVGP
jgi:LCP family protein required for cell wall assembly